jgi:hypothetical protein
MADQVPDDFRFGLKVTDVVTIKKFPNLDRFGPLAGKLISGAEEQGVLHAFDDTGLVATYNLGVAVEDIDLVVPNENFFGVNFGSSRLLGVPREAWRTVAGDIVLTAEVVTPGTSGLFRVYWNGTTLTAEPFPLGATSAPVAQWEHTTFAAAGIVEIP